MQLRLLCYSLALAVVGFLSFMLYRPQKMYAQPSPRTITVPKAYGTVKGLLSEKGDTFFVLEASDGTIRVLDFRGGVIFTATRNRAQLAQFKCYRPRDTPHPRPERPCPRSEERRVGKECR